MRSIKQLKRSDVIHFHSKNPLGGNTTNDLNKQHIYEPTAERFQNLLTVVRPPYATGNGAPPNITSVPLNASITQTSTHQHQPTTSFRSTRSTSARGSLGYHITSNTIIV